MTQEFIVSLPEDENDGDFSADDLSLREAIAQIVQKLIAYNYLNRLIV